ncbi:WXG100 family type VII secretion target [Nocardia brasiliensis]|uniref:WXG100 family type VII secretion target n=1 Tax=Nocardia brasiliensis TaxID=37326 RepID=UPI001894DD77|nr:WXG100 family type VII secretion target [Nocardia brasiliensis]MBF6126594.1 WXG100 family type VII secretion target [Nocardia brasiliensis]
MTDQYRVDLAHLESVTARIGGLTGFVEQSLREVDERVVNVQAGWSGTAADAHAAAHAEWSAAAVKVNDGLTKMKQAAATARQSYEMGTSANLSALGRNVQGAQ